MKKLEITDLKKISIVNQALDNQWLPLSLLDEVYKNNSSLSFYHKERDEQVKREFIRSILNYEQLISNRAFLINNNCIRQYYSDQHTSDCDSFKELLKESAIVAYFYNEETPMEKPVFSVNEDDFEKWLINVSLHINAVKLNWDQEENKQEINRRLSFRFHSFLDTFFITGGSLAKEHLAKDLFIENDQVNSFLLKMGEVRDFCYKNYVEFFANEDINKKYITRNKIYETFVCKKVDQVKTNPIVDGYYDSQKPFSKQIKILSDLIYNVSLSDALQRYTLTPIDSIKRKCLYELTSQESRKETISNDKLITYIDTFRNVNFDLMADLLFYQDINDLALEDIIEIRNSEKWKLYIKSFDMFLNDPFNSDLANPLVYNYIDMTKQVVEINNRRRSKKTLNKVIPYVEAIFDIAGNEILRLKFIKDVTLKNIVLLSPEIKIAIKNACQQAKTGFVTLSCKLYINFLNYHGNGRLVNSVSNNFEIFQCSYDVVNNGINLITELEKFHANIVQNFEPIDMPIIEKE